MTHRASQPPAAHDSETRARAERFFRACYGHPPLRDFASLDTAQLEEEIAAIRRIQADRHGLRVS